VVRRTIEFRDMVLAEVTSALKKDSPKVARVCHGVYMPSLQDSLPVVMFVSTDMPPLTGLVSAELNSNWFLRFSYIVNTGAERDPVF